MRWFLASDRSLYFMGSWWSWWPAASRLLSLLQLKDMMAQAGRENSAEETAAPDVEMGAATGEENTTPTTLAAADSEAGDDQDRRLRGQTLAAETSMASFPGEIHHTTGGSQMDDAHTGQLEQSGRMKRIYEHTKKVISYELLMLAALLKQSDDYFKIWAFKVSAAMLLLAFFTDYLCAVLLLNSCHFLTEYPIYLSSVTQMIMPLFLFFSFGELHPYMMILTAPLLFFAAALFHLACFVAGTTTDASKLDHIFDISAGVYALSAGSALTSAIVISEKPVATSPLACSLFLTIFIARYLMLITTLHTPGIVNHADTLMYLLKLLVTSTVILVALELLGHLLAMVAISVGIADVVLTFMSMLAHSIPTRKEKEPIDERKDQQLLSAVTVAIPFMALTQTYSEHYTGQDSTLISAAKLRMLLYFVPLVCSLNRMLVSLGGIAAPPRAGGRTAVKVLSALEWVRTSIVVVAVMDMIYKFGMGLMYDKVVSG